MPKIEVRVTVSYRGIPSTISVLLPGLPVNHMTVAEALAYADGLVPHDDFTNSWLRTEIFRAVHTIRNAGGEE